MKKASRILTLMLALAVILSVTAYAAQQSSRYICRDEAALTTGCGYIDVSLSVTATGYMSWLGATKIELYTENDDLVKTIWWTDAVWGQEMMSNNSILHAGAVRITVAETGTYYVTVYFYASNSTGSDTIPYTSRSATVTCVPSNGNN